MRKKHTAIFLCLAVTLFSALIFTACGSLYDEYKKSISDWRDVILKGEAGGYGVTVISGVREINFGMDGVSGDKTDYTLFTVTPPSGAGSVAIEVTVDGAKFQLMLDKHPLGQTYSAEAPARTRGKSLTMSVNGVDLTAETVVPDIRITGENALEISKSTLSLDTAEEIYVRLIENPVISDGCYYWYVATYTGGSTKAVLIDISTGEILAERK